MVHLKSLVATAAALFTYAYATPTLPHDRRVMLPADRKVMLPPDRKVMLPADRKETVCSQHGKVIEGSYIVTLKPSFQSQDLDSHIQWVGSVSKQGVNKRQFKGVEKTFSSAYGFHGYAGSFDEDTLAEIRSHPDVNIVEEDKVWELSYTKGLPKRELTTQSDAPWGLAAISHRHADATDYIYDANAGQGTFAYVVDTGVLLSHSEFEGRASLGFTAFPGETGDEAGHGTHTSGIIAGKTFGVAKKASIIGVKVFQGRFSATSNIVSGFTWAANDIVAKNRTAKSAINLSLDAPYTASLNQAVDAASGCGVLSIVASGNQFSNASDFSPASAATAITVGAIDADWAVADYSNWGEAVDIFAPGSDITSAWSGNDDDVETLSGTSMATPHVVGLALSAMSVAGVSGVDAVTKHLISTATANKIAGELNASPNLIGNNGNAQQEKE